MEEYKNDQFHHNEDAKNLKKQTHSINTVLSAAGTLPKDVETNSFLYNLTHLLHNFEEGNIEAAEISFICINPDLIVLDIANIPDFPHEKFAGITMTFTSKDFALDTNILAMRMILNLIQTQSKDYDYKRAFIDMNIFTLIHELCEESADIEMLILYRIISLLSTFSEEAHHECMSFIDFDLYDRSLSVADNDMIFGALQLIDSLLGNEKTKFACEDDFIADSFTYLIHVLNRNESIKDNNIYQSLKCIIHAIDYQDHGKDMLMCNMEILESIYHILLTNDLNKLPYIGKIYKRISETEKLPKQSLQAFIDVILTTETMDKSLTEFFSDAVEIIAAHLFSEELAEMCVNEGCLNALRMICEDGTYETRKKALFVICKYLTTSSVEIEASALEEIKASVELIEKSEFDESKDSEEVEETIDSLFDILSSL